MYLRIINLTKGAARYRYLKLVESTRVKGKPVQKTILNFGDIEDWPPERVADLISRLTYFFELSPGPGPEDLSVQEAREFGARYALDALWNQLGLSETLRTLGTHHVRSTDASSQRHKHRCAVLSRPL